MSDQRLLGRGSRGRGGGLHRRDALDEAARLAVEVDEPLLRENAGKLLKRLLPQRYRVAAAARRCRARSSARGGSMIVARFKVQCGPDRTEELLWPLSP